MLAAEALQVFLPSPCMAVPVNKYTVATDTLRLYKVAQALTKIPFISNGDIPVLQEAKQRIEEVGALTQSWLRELPWEILTSNHIYHYFETGEILPDLTFEDKIWSAYEHLKRLILTSKEKTSQFVNSAASLLTLFGTSGAAKLRGAISQASTLAEIEAPSCN